ncbi:MAG: hypothetical protein HQK53_06385 [Oligoflexia bacterium]|nr:hypothetical protein [Oligoflexia bacterium]
MCLSFCSKLTLMSFFRSYVLVFLLVAVANFAPSSNAAEFAFVDDGTVLFSLSEEKLLQEYPLVSIVSEPENNLVHNLILNLDDNWDLTGLFRRSVENQDYFTYEDLMIKNIVLARNSGRDAILLSAKKGFDRALGGNLDLSYLYNGATKNYHHLNLKLERLGATAWGIFTDDHRPIHSLTIKPRYFLGMLIGVEVQIN